MKHWIQLACCLSMLFFSFNKPGPRQVETFNAGWLFHLESSKGTTDISKTTTFPWKRVIIPHDWSNESFFSKTNTGASTGFLPGGIGWYQKPFYLPETDRDKVISINFDGVYNNAKV